VEPRCRHEGGRDGDIQPTTAARGIGEVDDGETGPVEAGDRRPHGHNVDALLDGYEELRPLDGPEASALEAVLPVAHIEYALSEVEYFAAVVRSETNADLAYDDYLVGHARWFEGALGSALLGYLRRRAHRG